MGSEKEKRSDPGCVRTVLPLVFTYSLTLFLSGVTVQNLYLQKLCSPAGPPGINYVCQSPESLAAAADVNILRSVLRDCVSGLPVILAGGWRDRTGLTRPLLALSLAGEVLAAAVAGSGYYFWTASSWLVAAVEGAIISLTGGRLLFFMAIYCYIVDRTPLQERTHRLTLMMVALLAGASIAMASTGYILSALNYPLFFSLVIALLALNIALCFLLIKEKAKKQTNERSLLNVSSLKTVFHSRPNNLTVWVMLISGVTIGSSVVGESSIYMYYLEQGFNYSVTKGGIYLSYRMGVGVVGSLVFSPLASKVFKWDDFIIMIVSLGIAICCGILTAFAKSELELYIITLLDWSRAICMSVSKSIMSRHLQSEEFGAFFSLYTIGEAVIPLALLPLYDGIFKVTLKTLPGAFFLLSAGIYVFILFIQWLLIIYKGRDKEPDTENQNNKSNKNKDLTLNKDCDNNKNIQITTSSQIASENS